MDAEILNELGQIRWLATVIAIAMVIYVVAYVFFFGAGYRKAKMEDIFARGNSLLTKGKLDELMRLCDDHLLDFPADAGIYWLKGTAHYRRGEWNQALIAYRKTDQLQPGFAIGPSIAEIEEKIANAGASPDLRVVAPITPIQNAASSNEGSTKGGDA